MKCRECETDFLPLPQEEDGFIFYECPHCCRTFPIAKISKQGLKIRKQLNAKREQAAQYEANAPGGIVSHAEMGRWQIGIAKLETKFRREYRSLLEAEHANSGLV